MKNIVILAIESSCDDTGASIIIDGKVVSNCIATQLQHEKLGGVVPELASRQHMINIVPVVEQAISDAGITVNDLTAVAMTKGPGLLGSLLVGVSFGKSLAMSKGIPLIEVHHMQAHILAHFGESKTPSFPFLNLTVSGGHTQIVLVHDFLNMEVIGQTIDDAAGEAFDKIGKMLGLPYPAGPHVDKLARKGSANISFPVPNVEGLDFSFSGFKTAVMYYLQKQVKEDPNYIKDHLTDICASVQKSIVHILIQKMEKALDANFVEDIGIAGGVSANSLLRDEVIKLGERRNKNVFIPSFALCTDNAAMIGVTGYFKYLEGQFTDLHMSPDPRMSM